MSDAHTPGSPAPAAPASLNPAVMYPGQGDPAAAPADPAAAPTDPTTPPADPAAPTDPSSPGFLSKREPGDPADPATPPAVPTPFDAKALKMEEGYELLPETMEAFSKIATDRGLSTEAAQELLDLQTSWQKNSFEESKALLAAQDKEWAEELSKDPDYAGANGGATKALIGSAVEQFGTPEVYQVLDAYGLGNNPALVRFIANLAKAVGEGRPTPPGQPRANGGVTVENAPLPQRLYPAHYNPDGSPKTV